MWQGAAEHYKQTLCCAGGLATLAEKKSRRMELALYVASRAVESFARCLLLYGYYPARLVSARGDLCLR